MAREMNNRKQQVRESVKSNKKYDSANINFRVVRNRIAKKVNYFPVFGSPAESWRKAA